MWVFKSQGLPLPGKFKLSLWAVGSKFWDHQLSGHLEGTNVQRLGYKDIRDIRLSIMSLGYLRVFLFL